MPDAPLDAFSMASPRLLGVVSPAGAWIAANPALLDAARQPPEALPGLPLDALIHPEDIRAFRQALVAAAAGAPPQEVPARLLRGDEPPLALRWSCFADRGRIFLSGQAGDEAEARDSLAELQRRARNTLAIIRVIARRTAWRGGTAEDHAARLDARLGAFSRLQAALLRAMPGGVGLEELVTEALSAVAATDGRRARIAGPELRLPAAVAETLGLALHELAANAAEHGALARQGGQLSVSWEVAGQVLRLRWEETGAGQVPETPGGGFGLELLGRALPYELAAVTRWSARPDGILFEAEIPLAPSRG